MKSAKFHILYTPQKVYSIRRTADMGDAFNPRDIPWGLRFHESCNSVGGGYVLDPE